MRNAFAGGTKQIAINTARLDEPPEQGKEALVAINDTAYKILTVPVPAKEKNILVDSTFLELTDNGIKGNIKLNLSGYYAMDMHSLLSHSNSKDQEKT